MSATSSPSPTGVSSFAYSRLRASVICSMAPRASGYSSQSRRRTSASVNGRSTTTSCFCATCNVSSRFPTASRIAAKYSTLMVTSVPTILMTTMIQTNVTGRWLDRMSPEGRPSGKVTGSFDVKRWSHFVNKGLATDRVAVPPLDARPSTVYDSSSSRKTPQQTPSGSMGTPGAALASTAATAMATAAPKKPWRYYYVMAFPLSNTPSKDKLAGMLELTDSIEQREEAYLQRMLDRDPPPEPARRASPLARYIMATLKWLSGMMAVAALAVIVCVYEIQVSSMGEELDPRVVSVAYVAAAVVFAQNVAIIAAVEIQSSLLLRGCVLLLCLAIGGIVFLLDEMKTVIFSQEQLAAAIKQPRRAFSDTQIQLVLNGGEEPSLWHRFFVDGPSWFLLWLERHCVTASNSNNSTTTTDNDLDGSSVDAPDFFTPLWEPRVLQCTNDCLSTHRQLESVLHGTLTGVLVAMTMQLALTILTVWIDQIDDPDADTDTTTDGPTAISRKRKRRHRQQNSKRDRSQPEVEGGPGAFPIALSLTGLVRLACVGLALTGGTLTVVSYTLLTSCSFVGPIESWMLALVGLFGGLQLLAALCTIFMWRQQFVKSVLVGGLALESYVTSSLTDFCAAISGPPILGRQLSREKASLLQSAYDMIFQQTCQPMKHWRLHVCVVTGDSVVPTPHSVAHVGLRESPTCQDELAALLRTTADHSLVLLSWMMAAQVVVLVWLLLPSIRAKVHNTLAFICCRSSSGKNEVAVAVHELQKRNEELAAKKAKLSKHATLQLADARRKYLATMKRTDAAAMQAEAAAFDAEWTKMTRAHTASDSAASSSFVASMAADSSVMFAHQFEAIVRSLVLRRLTVQCKLDVNLSISRDGSTLFARLFASDNLLMTTLCQCGPAYKLQFADPIDPGDVFWQDPREIRNDTKILDTHTIHQKFKLLQLHGVITRKEAEIFPTESLTRVSARVHALMRIDRWRRGTLEPTNRHAVFVEYLPQRQLQYLYKRYPNRLDTAATAQQRRAAVLRTVDCLRLTRQILDAEFDLDVMLRRDQIDAFTELHSASRFDTISRESLLAVWLAFWRPQYLPGEFAPHSHWLLNQLGRLSPFRQPLQAVRDYFGECIAFYFAWLAYYNQWLLVPTLVSAVLLATRTLNDTPLGALVSFCTGANTPTHFRMHGTTVVFGLAVVAWGAAFAKGWERRSVWYRLEWGMDDPTDDNGGGLADRANFRGVRRRNPVTQQHEVYFPSRKRLQRQLASALIIGGVGVVHLAVCFLLLLAQGPTSQWLGERLAVGLICFTIALLMLWNGDAISALAHHLSEWENYQNERDFQRGVIVKVCVLQLFNSYGPLLLVTFALYHTNETACPLPPMLCHWARAFHTQIAPHINVIVQLQLLLALVFAMRIASHILLMLHGLLRDTLRRQSVRAEAPPAVESELALQAYRGSYEDYTEIVVQLGLVTMFSSIFPLAPALAFIECAIELRLDALDLCLFLQRPTPEPASGIGPWAACIRAVLALAAVVNLALLYFVADNYAQWSLVRRIGAFLASGLLAWVASELLWRLVPTENRGVAKVRARHAFLVDRYFGDGGDSGDNARKTRGSEALRDVERKALDLQLASDATDVDDDDDDGDTTPAHFHERLALLRRLNTALRKHDEALEPRAAEATAPPLDEQHESVIGDEVDEQDPDEERAIVGYFVRRNPPTTREEVQATAEATAAPEPDLVGAETIETVVVPVDSAAEEIGAIEATAGVATTPTAEQYERTTLTGLTAIHVAAEREQFDFAQDTGWHPEQQAGSGRRGSLSQSLSKRFSLFRKRRASMDDTPPTDVVSSPSVAAAATTSTVATSTTPASSAAIKRGSRTKRPTEQPARTRRESSGSELPVLQLSGLEAVHEAARRDNFNFSTNPWEDRGDASESR